MSAVPAHWRTYSIRYRVQQSRHHGQGIGLSIVRRLSERFGWPVSLDSEPGKGTIACIRFPEHDRLEGGAPRGRIRGS